MDAVTTPRPPAAPTRTRRPWSIAKALDLVVALAAHVAVGGAWALVALSVMEIGRAHV